LRMPESKVSFGVGSNSAAEYREHTLPADRGSPSIPIDQVSSSLLRQ
jgi:hypothetical protein